MVDVCILSAQSAAQRSHSDSHIAFWNSDSLLSQSGNAIQYFNIAHVPHLTLDPSDLLMVPPGPGDHLGQLQLGRTRCHPGLLSLRPPCVLPEAGVFQARSA